MQIPFLDLRIGHALIKDQLQHEWSRIISDSGFINGKHVETFATSLSNYLNSQVVTCGNGTDALQIALMALGLQRGDKLIIPTFTYISAVEVAVLLGLEPVLVDVDPDTFNIDTTAVGDKISSEVKAIIPVHLFGQSCEMDRIQEIASTHDLYVIEDNAQSLGSQYKIDGQWQMTGTIGTIGTTSFFPSKVLGAMGDGGAVFSKDKNLLALVRQIANHGQYVKYSYEHIGVNSRLDTLQAALLEIKLKHLNVDLQKRGKVAEIYDKTLSEIAWLQVPAKSTNSTHVYHQYTIKIKNGMRNKLRDYLQGHGIPTMVYYPIPTHSQKAYKYLGYTPKDFPNTEYLCESVLSLPIYPDMPMDHIDYIIEKIKKFNA